VTVGGEMVLSSSSQEFGSETSVNFEGGADCPELTPLPSPSASCSEDQISFEITLLTTNPTLQTHWSIIDVKTQNIAAYGPEAATAYNVNTLYSTRECLAYKEYRFTMFGGLGDGTDNGGSFDILIDGSLFWNASFLFGSEFPPTKSPTPFPTTTNPPSILISLLPSESTSLTTTAAFTHTTTPSTSSPLSGRNESLSKVANAEFGIKDRLIVIFSIAGGLAVLIAIVIIGTLWKKRWNHQISIEIEDVEKEVWPEDLFGNSGAHAPVVATDRAAVGYFKETTSPLLEQVRKDGEGNGIEEESSIDEDEEASSSDDEDEDGDISEEDSIEETDDVSFHVQLI